MCIRDSSVGEIFVPKKSQFKKLSDTEYIDEWGICRRFTGLYWDAVNAPLKLSLIHI